MDWSTDLHGFLPRDLLNEPEDPRVGSGRDGASGGTVSHLSSSGSDSASAAALGSTFVPVTIYSAVCLLAFVVFRRKCHRAYSPRAIPGIRSFSDPSPTLPSGWFNWIKPFLQLPDEVVLNNGSLDGFLFLRYLKVLSIICLVGCLLTWLVLLPIHGTGENALKELSLLTIGNVAKPLKFYAHLAIAWVFFGFVLFMVSRECIYYINLRQAYLMSPSHAHRLSARTVLFTCVPQRFLDAPRVRKLFGDSVKNVWIPRDTKALQRLVKERQQTAERLEKAEITLIKSANAVRNKQLHAQSRQPSDQAACHSPSPEAKGVVEADDVIAPTKQETNQEPEATTLERLPTATNPSSSSSDHRPFSSPNRAEALEPKEDEYTHPYGLSPALPDIRGSVAAQYLPADARPRHRPLANFGRRVDTIRWTRDRIRTLNAHIAKVRRRLRDDGELSAPLSAVFVEFDSQVGAQAAFQVLAHHAPLRMSPRFVGIRPGDVVWSSLRIRPWERIARRFLMMVFITSAVIFWSIPSAIVGIVSNIKFLSKSVPFLFWIDKLPSPVLGLIQGLLPAVALSLLMAAVPGMLRACARTAGVPSLPMVELFTQNAYFVFQIVQVFLITTLTSAASAAMTTILKDPLSAKDLLAQNLPKASNFYLSYILVQCLAGGSWNLAHFLDLLRQQWLVPAMQNPRQRYKAWRRLRPMHWGTVFPIYTNMGVIAICYSCIAPLVLAFAGLGMYFAYLVYKYNLIYSFSADVDTKGLVYPRALMHLLVGLYLAEVCLIGLFSLNLAFGPVVLMVLFLIFTALVHISLSDAVDPLLNSLPRSLTLEDEDLAAADDGDGEAIVGRPENGIRPVAPNSAQGGGAAAEYYNMEEGGLAAHGVPPYEEEEEWEGQAGPLDADTTPRGGVEGADNFASSIGAWVRSFVETRIDDEVEESGLSRVLGRVRAAIVPSPDREPNFALRFLRPDLYETHRHLRRLIAPAPPAGQEREREQEEADIARRGYWPPEMWSPAPRLWIPRDDARVSRQEVAHTRKFIPISDRGAWLNEKGRVEADLSMAPFEELRVLY